MRSRIFTITAAVCFAACLAPPLRAQGVTRIPRNAPTSRAAGLAPTNAEQAPSGQYSPQELEELRAQLLGLAYTVQQFGAVAPSVLVDLDGLTEAKDQIQQMSYPALNTLRQGISPSKLSSRLQRAQQGIDVYTSSKGLNPRALLYSDPTPLPNANGLCTSAHGSDVSRIPTAAILAADVVFFVADGVREFAQDACKQEAVIAGEGGNTSLACIAVDTVWIAAKAVDEGIHFCDDDLTGAVVDANFSRLADVHTDVNNVGTTLDTHLANADTHLTNVNTDIDTRIANADTHLTNVNADIDTRIANLDTHLTNVDNHVANEFTALTTLTTTLIGNLSAQLTAATMKLMAGEQQIMKLELEPEGQRQLVGAILTCDGTAANPCPAVLVACQATGCSWNSVGPLP